MTAMMNPKMMRKWSIQAQLRHPGGRVCMCVRGGGGGDVSQVAVAQYLFSAHVGDSADRKV